MVIQTMFCKGGPILSLMVLQLNIIKGIGHITIANVFILLSLHAAIMSLLPKTFL